MSNKLRTKSPLSYFGSDSQVAGELAAMLDHCKHVTIVFCGGLAILPHLKATHIVANDLHEHAINFYRLVSASYGPDFDDLYDMCENTLSHPSELSRAEDWLVRGNKVERAWAFWAQCWIGRKGKGGTKNQSGMPSVRRTASGGSNASRIRSAAWDLKAWRDEFRRCEFESVCFRELLPKVADQKGIGCYLDPCWIGAGDNYLHTMLPQDHRDLARLLSRFQSTTIVLRYGDDLIIRKLYAGWDIQEASSRTQAGTDVGEIWITKNLRS